MDKLRINGGSPLKGQVRISGAKNSALPAMAASLLTAEELVLGNIPLLNDIFTTRRLLRELGVDVELEPDHTVRLKAANIRSHVAPYDLVKTMRASVLVLGPLLARTGKARVSLPGAARSEPDRSIFTSKVLRSWERRSGPSMDMLKRAPGN